ncbi:MAG TPA: PrsW family glutamic-type intramembrane protease [Saprospiraceae bacterium]|nr:PrsW family glutamic-type intramembrane protease [Saprospiraceae bacterium]
MIYTVSFLSVFIYCVLIYGLVGSSSKEKPLRLFFCVLMGAVSASLALVAEYFWNFFLGDFIALHPSLILLESFIGVGFFEEAAKWLWLVFVAYHWKTFDRYTDGILYACGIAAGFNLVEGSLYVSHDTEFMNHIVRGFTAVPVHFLFGIIMGFLFARYKLESRKFFWLSLVIPILLHGLYDFFIFQQYTDLLMGGAILVFAGCLSLSVWVCRNALRADRLRLDK